MSITHFSSISLTGAMCKACNARSLSSPDFKHFNRVLLTVYIVLSTRIQVSCSKSQFAENFLNSSKVNSGLLSEKTSKGIPCLANIAFIFFITISEVFLKSLLISKYLN